MTLPFWDEMSDESLTNGLPWALTDLEIELDDGCVIPNPLASYKFQKSLAIKVTPSHKYSKPKDYETVRFPLSGLVANSEDRKKTE